jgi:uncharacterized protein YkwD
MKNRYCRFALVAVAFLTGSLLSVAAPAAHAATTFESRALELINGARAAAGVAPVQLSPSVASIAGDAPYDGCGYRVTGRAADMGIRNYFSHTILSCGSQDVSHILKAAGVTYTNVAENIAWVSAITDPLIAAERLHNDLMDSPAHRANILDPKFTHVGIGSWQTASGASWSGSGTPLRNVFVTAQVFITAPAAGARYHPLTPTRILDTRTAGTPLGSAALMDLQVAGAGGVPASGASAVVLNVAVTGPTATSFLTVFPAGEALPLASNLNFDAGQTVPNLVTAKLGVGGRLSLYNAFGSTHLIADVAGWYDTGTVPSGARFHPLTPSRILDTRATGPIGPATALALLVAGKGGVPAVGASAVVMNVAVTGPTATGYLSVFPTGEAVPLASNLNFVAGETVPNLVTAKLGIGGGVQLYNAMGSSNVIVDVAGWYDDGTSATGATYHPLTPSRILDTRNGSGPLGAAAVMDVQVAGQGGVPAAGVSAVVTNVAVTGPTATSFLTVFPTGEALPLASNLDFGAGQTVPNLVVAKQGAGGRLSIYNAAGTTHVIADVAGWFD